MSLPESLTNSRWELEEFSRRRATGIYCGEDRMLCRILGQFPAFVDAKDVLLTPRLVLDGYWEPWVTLAIARNIKPGFRCVDVGANYGYYTLLMAGACGPTGHVIACEPNPLLTNDYIPRNLAVNGLSSRVTICPKIIGNAVQTSVDFVMHEDDLATSSMSQWANPNKCKTIQVSETTLDHELRGCDRVDLIKVDAEGAEAIVWDGMRETRRRFPNVACVVELHMDRDHEQAMRFMRQAIADGYRLRYINYEAELVQTTPEHIAANQDEHWMLWLQR